jgi:hypothetical protein
VKLNGTYQLLAYADDVNLLGDNIDTVKKAQILELMLVSVGLETKADGAAGQNHDTETTKGFSVNEIEFLEMLQCDELKMRVFETAILPVIFYGCGT